MLLRYRSEFISEHHEKARKRKSERKKKVERRKYINSVKNQLEDAFTPDIASDIWDFLYYGKYNDVKQEDLPVKRRSEDICTLRWDLYNFVPYHWSLDYEESCKGIAA